MFWINNPRVLFKKKDILLVIPSKDMSLDEKLNALTRLSILLTFIFVVLELYDYLSIPLVIIALTILMKMYDNKKENKKEYKKKSKPSKVNPYMNYTANDFNNDKELPTNLNPDPLQSKQLHDEDLYINNDNIYHNKTSERQFYKLQDQYDKRDEFINWLYGDGAINPNTKKECVY